MQYETEKHKYTQTQALIQASEVNEPPYSVRIHVYLQVSVRKLSGVVSKISNFIPNSADADPSSNISDWTDDDALLHLLHSELHWLAVPERIQHKLGVTGHRCLQGEAPQYVIECCTPTSEVASRQRLRSASRHQLVMPRHRRSKFGRRAFSVAGPMVWNSLPDHLRDPTLGSDCFKSRLKTHLFSLY